MVLIYGEPNPQEEAASPSTVSADRCRYLPPEEERDFYAGLGVALTLAELRRVRRFTDGWLPAVRLVETLLEQQGKETLLRRFDTILNDLVERQHFLGYSPDERLFAVGLSLLDDFPFELVRTLSGWKGEQLLELFQSSPLLRYDVKTKRFHFASYLQTQLETLQQVMDQSYRREFLEQVGDWYRDRGSRVEAVNAYRMAGTWEKIVLLVLQWTFPTPREVALCYSEAIAEMPLVLLEQYPLLRVIHCHMLCALYRYQDADRLIESFCLEYDRGEETPEVLCSVLGEAYVHWANTSEILAAKADKVIAIYRRAAELLPNGSAMVRTKLNLFADRPVIGLPSPEAGSMAYYLEFVRQAEPYVRKVTNSCRSGGYQLATAEMNFYTRNFTQVEAPARAAVGAALEQGQFDIACSAYFLLLRFNVAKGNYRRAVESLEQLRQCAAQARYETSFSMPDLAESWFSLKLGRKYEVADWIRDETLYQKRVLPWNYGRDRVVRCYYLLEVQQFDQVLLYAEESILLLQRRGYHLTNLYLLMMKAVALHNMGRWQEAAAELEEVYRWCHQNHIVMPVVEFGSLIRPLLQDCRRAGGTAVSPEWMEDIGKKAGSYYTYVHNIRKEHERKWQMQNSMLERLTTAELRLLLLLYRGTAVREIAQQTGRSIGSVKGMSRRIYEKLGAGGKAEAVRIAAESNIESFVKV